MENLTLPGWGREFEPKCQVLNIFFGLRQSMKRTWLFQNMEKKGKDIAFVSKWLTQKGLTKLCSVFEGMYEHRLNMLNIHKS